MGHKRRCNRMPYLISPLRGALRLWLPRNRVHACVCPLGLIHHERSRAGTSVGENKRKRRGHAIAAKFTWKLKGGSIDAFCIKLMYRESCEEIFSSRVTWARATAMPSPSTPPHKSPRVNLCPNKKRKIIPPSERIFAVEKAPSYNSLETFKADTKCTLVHPRLSLHLVTTC